jgi:hypothetical protein
MSEQEPLEPDWSQYEKAEKAEEKEEKEHREEEKTWEEKWRRDPLNTAGWAALFIWAGIVLILQNVGRLEQFSPVQAWDLILLGAGGIVLLQVLVRLLVPAYRRPIIGSLVLGVFLVIAGLRELLPFDIAIPIALIFLGLAILVTALIRRR